MNYPCGLSSDGEGFLFVAEYLGCRIRRLDPSGVLRTVAGTPGVPGFLGGYSIFMRLWISLVVFYDMMIW